jgi:hypothetical protein
MHPGADRVARIAEEPRDGEPKAEKLDRATKKNRRLGKKRNQVAPRSTRVAFDGIWARTS